MRIALVVLSTVVAVTLSAAQDGIETLQTDWHISPTLSLGKFFPGSPVVATTRIYWPAGGTIIDPSSSDFRYSATALDFSVRCFKDDIRNIAFTFGAGAHWFYGSERQAITSPVVSMASDGMTVVNGIGELSQPRDFMVFPVTVGLQVTVPHDRRELIMAFAGIEGNLDFVSGNVPTGQQAKVGYGLVAGFAVRIFEFGVRYTEFSDLKNLGAYFGFRLNPINL